MVGSGAQRVIGGELLFLHEVSETKRVLVKKRSPIVPVAGLSVVDVLASLDDHVAVLGVLEIATVTGDHHGDPADVVDGGLIRWIGAVGIHGGTAEPGLNHFGLESANELRGGSRRPLLEPRNCRVYAER